MLDLACRAMTTTFCRLEYPSFCVDVSKPWRSELNLGSTALEHRLGMQSACRGGCIIFGRWWWMPLLIDECHVECILMLRDLR